MADRFGDEDELREEGEGGGGLPIPAFARDPRGVLRRRWRAMLVAFVATAGLGAAVALQIPLQYEAATRVLLTSKQIPEEFVRSTIQQSPLEQFYAIEGRVLTRETLAEMIREHDLYPEARQGTSAEALSSRLKGSITIEAVSGWSSSGGRSGSTVFEISASGSRPEKLAAVANEVASRLVEQNMAFREEQASVTTDFMARELERADRALREHQREMARFREEHRGSLPEELEANLAKLERLQQQRESLALQIGEVERQLAALAEREPGESTPDRRLQQMRAELERQLALHTEEHPNVRSLRRQIEALEKAVEERGEGGRRPSERELMQQEVRGRLDSLRSQLARTDERIEELDALVSKTAGLSEEWGALVRREQVLRENYNEYLRKLKDAELAQSLERAQQGVRLSRLERALPPTAPQIPRWLLVAGALAASVGLSAAVAVGLELLAPVVLTGEQLESLARAPTLGSVPKIV